ncbi:MAG: DUF4166 domain-containing protein [Proteobacteria bacterium]|nr:DUF4166 domain-containing protein [Pseudomonadota bacterium]
MPTLPALALVRRIHHGALDFTGAAPCTGFIAQQDFAADFARIGVTTQKNITHPAEPIFAAALGEAFNSLFLVTQDIHRPDPVLALKGEAEVDEATNPLAKLAAWIFEFPPAASSTRLSVVIEADEDGTEHWARIFPDRVMRSIMAAPNAETCSVEERFGLFRFRLRLDLLCSKLAMVPLSAHWGPIPIPKFLRPHIKATERATSGWHYFDVDIALPLIGRLVHYRGWLATVQSNKAPKDQEGPVSTCPGATTNQSEPAPDQRQSCLTR